MSISKAAPIALALCYLEQDPLGFKILMEDINPANFMDLLQESLMWNARFIQKAGMDANQEPQAIAQQIISQIKMKEILP